MHFSRAHDANNISETARNYSAISSFSIYPGGQCTPRAYIPRVISLTATNISQCPDWLHKKRNSRLKIHAIRLELRRDASFKCQS